MLDRLLGRAELKAHLDDLAEERDRLEARLDAESERRRSAARRRQEAETAVNRLQDRVAELEDRVERAETGDETPSLRGTATLRGDRLDEVLARLESVHTGPEGALTAMVDGDLPDAVRDRYGERSVLVERAAPALVCTDDEGLVSAALRPAIAPEPFVEWGDAFAIDRAWFEPRGRHAVALVRADLFAIGEFDGRERLSVSGFESDVKGDHSKGGWSQGRFERRRDAQIDAHLEAVSEALADRDADTLYLLGEKTLLHEFADVADVTRPSDATGKPTPALESAVADLWTARLWLL